uniref:Phosphoenolpyruvate carboxykinase [GTP] n=1 Tax=Ascaris lumbricoides TaxID=6252 RepID=A0A0M3IBW2_ASCLU
MLCMSASESNNNLCHFIANLHHRCGWSLPIFSTTKEIMQDGIEQQHTPSLTTIRSDANEEGIRSLRPLPDDSFSIINEVIISGVGSMPIIKGDLRQLPIKVQRFVIEKASLMRPRGIYICDGSVREADEIVAKLVERRTLSVLTAYENNYICRTDPQDVTESIAWIATPGKFQTVCRTNDDVVPIMCNWISPAECGKELDSRFPGCMTGRVMYVIPFSLGVICGPFSKIGIELTDSNYTVLCMRIMTRVSPKVFEALGDGDFVRCIHSVGLPRPAYSPCDNWPCNTDLAFLVHRPAEREIWSFGSGFGSNSLLGRKSMALRVASAIARDEGWLAEHMAVFSAASFLLGVGASILVTASQWRILAETASFGALGWFIVTRRENEASGDDIAWLRFGDDGRLYAINPEAGFFGIAPGLSKRTNPVAMAMLRKNCIFTNVAETANGEFFWQGLENEIRAHEVRAAHHNARYAAPASQCQLMHYKWDSPKGVPIDAILFGARRFAFFFPLLKGDMITRDTNSAFEAPYSAVSKAGYKRCPNWRVRKDGRMWRGGGSGRKGGDEQKAHKEYDGSIYFLQAFDCGCSFKIEFDRVFSCFSYLLCSFS